MNISHPNKKQKSRGQGIVEFALALPILLTLIYGLLETGRLLFIYGSTVTAARQAVRYGSATGIGPNGMPYYEDCTGIEGAANRVGFINVFDTIDITYDGGLDSSTGDPIDLSPPNPACGAYTEDDVANGDRILVSVSAQWVPIVPIIPFDPFTITSQSERTILASVSIYVTAVPKSYDSNLNGAASLVITADSDTYTHVGETIIFTYKIKNIGSGELFGPFEIVNPSIGTPSCPGAPGSLLAGASYTCGTISYQITDADLLARSVTNSAQPVANSVIFAAGTKVITLLPLPSLELSKSPSITSTTTVGTEIIYTYTLENTGNVNFDSLSIFDDKISGVDCSAVTIPMVPGATAACQATYTVTNPDLSVGSIVNNATASATYLDASSTSTSYASNTATATVITSVISMSITPSPIAVSLPTDVITYTYSVINTGTTDVDSFSISDNLISPVTCPSTTISAGSSITCTGTYSVTQATLDAGGEITNTATASGNNGLPVSTVTTATVPITQTPSLLAAVSASPTGPTSPSTSLPAGTIIDYTYVLTNTGNVTLSSPITVTDDKATFDCSSGPPTMAPGATKNCTGTHIVTVGDVDAGSVINSGSGSATFNALPVTSNTVSATVITFSGERFSLSTSQNKTIVTPIDPTIAFTYTLTNTGGTTLNQPYTISSSLGSTLLIAGTGGSNTTTPITPDCTSAAANIAPGASTNCTYTYSHPSGTGSSAFVHTTSTASIGALSASSLPPVMNSTAYNCTSSNFTVSSLTTGSGPDQDKVTWVITNTVGLNLPISSISLNWANSGTGGNDWRVDAVSLNNSSSIAAGVFPDSSSPYNSGNGTLTGSSSAASVTTVTFDFSKNNPTGMSASIAMASPYGGCSR